MRNCFLCDTPAGEAFHTVREVPIHANLLAGTKEKALRCDRGDIALALCPACGLIFNAEFDAKRVSYAEGYETSLFASPTFRAYAKEQARALATELDLRGKRVLEFGCGRGEFLRLLCEESGCHGIGVDPSQPDSFEELAEGSLTIRGEELSAEALTVRGTEETSRADASIGLVLSRHVLEHLELPVPFLEFTHEISRSSGARVYFEVPDGHYTLRHGGIWDVIYEHCSYFTATSLAGAFERASLQPVRIASTYGGQFLTILADATPTCAQSREEERRALQEEVRDFARVEKEKREALEELVAREKSIALWGAGSKGTTLLNLIDPDGSRIPTVVDASEHKQGRFVSGTGQRILAPEELPTVAPDLVLVTNALYEQEIAATLTSLGLGSRIETV